ncbi:MAG TPA: hypothetical protein VGB87_16515 [Vicinamibacteria bacterium]
MIRSALALLLTVIPLGASPASAQTADEIIARSFEARGGLAKVKAILGLRMTGRATVAPGTEAPMTVEIQRPSSLRLEFTFDGKKAVQAFDGRQAWGIAPGEAQPRVLPAEAGRSMAQQTDLEGPLADHAQKGHKIGLVGREKLRGKDVWRLRVTRRDGDVEDHLIDATTYLPVLVSVERTVRGSTIHSETRFGDYRPIKGGYLWPFRLESGAAGRSERQVMQLEDVEVDPDLDVARFSMPGGRSSGRRY